jgi:hypothetical protein
MNLTCAESVQATTGILPVKSEPAHVRDIEKASTRPGLVVLFDDRTVSNGKFPPGIVDHLAAESIMELGKRSPCGP